jgi:hypothetical protein
MEEFQSFRTICPYCEEDGCLYVIEVRLVEFPEVEEIYMCSPLHKDGFEIINLPTYVPQDSDLSTEMEMVRCENCDAKFDLSEVIVG